MRSFRLSCPDRVVLDQAEQVGPLTHPTQVVMEMILRDPIDHDAQLFISSVATAGRSGGVPASTLCCERCVVALCTGRATLEGRVLTELPTAGSGGGVRRQIGSAPGRRADRSTGRRG